MDTFKDAFNEGLVDLYSLWEEIGTYFEMMFDIDLMNIKTRFR